MTITTTIINALLIDATRTRRSLRPPEGVSETRAVCPREENEACVDWLDALADRLGTLQIFFRCAATWEDDGIGWQSFYEVVPTVHNQY